MATGSLEQMKQKTRMKSDGSFLALSGMFSGIGRVCPVAAGSRLMAA